MIAIKKQMERKKNAYQNNIDLSDNKNWTAFIFFSMCISVRFVIYVKLKTNTNKISLNCLTNFFLEIVVFNLRRIA